MKNKELKIKKNKISRTFSEKGITCVKCYQIVSEALMNPNTGNYYCEPCWGKGKNWTNDRANCRGCGKLIFPSENYYQEGIHWWHHKNFSGECWKKWKKNLPKIVPIKNHEN